MRVLFAASTAATAGLIAVGALGVAGAETTAPDTSSATPPRTVSVQGVAVEAIEQSANAASATAVYRQGMADSISDGLAKAQFLASKAGGTLGAAQSIAEGGGYIDCSGEGEYLGAQPDFGSSSIPGSVVALNNTAATTAPRPASVPSKKPASKHHKTHKRTGAKKAAVTSCTLDTQVALVYLLS